MEANVIYLVSGAAGGFLTALNFKLENPTIKWNWYKVARNLIIGAACGLYADTAWWVAFNAGLVGEFVLQNVGSKAYTKVKSK